MDNLAIPEYYPEPDSNGRLQLLLSLPDTTVTEELAKSLALVGGRNTGLYQAAGRMLMTVAADPGLDPDRFLLDSSAVLDSFNFQSGNSLRAELLEARIINTRTATEAASSYRISKKFRVTLDPEAACEGDDTHTIVLANGHVFGSGTHPSTRLAIQAMEDLAESLPLFPSRVLDVGCGSGVLSMVSALLGAEKVLGIDICTEAINLARQNVRQNSLAKKISINNDPIAEITDCFDLIIANLSPYTMIRMTAQLIERLAKKSHLVLSGFQSGQADILEKKLAGEGAEDITVYSKGRWQAMLVTFNHV